ncbi:uncharacterized protein C8Q71DRAFT_175469 [Rhodofomes roseus]|uniref:YokE-like PH domain-containing protein n=1 Tax=Rhodofomes roseus TaxID=34475 RepID=A0A4Y9XTY3_9APHY|nr:uncharacterized protein C8Q71DRAFT_175469 [Rhodofomes roseus]KAH9833775.1 hypothetical protein C8Q71DRAFT_175469 [Rhodofomes roseus]TFY52847.1 hypothetical protein EVJ58_g9781 [Rhodofomes roseus]
MALNYAMLSPARAPIPLPNELTIRDLNGGVELSLSIPDAPPSGASSSLAGGLGGAKKMKDVGKLWLTDQRLIFVSDNGSKSGIESLSVPLLSLSSTKFEQPYFGSNYLSIEIKPSPEGRLTDGTKAEIRFKDKGLFEFVSALEKTRERAIYMKRQTAEEDELPTYTPAADAGSSSSAYASRIPDDAPPGYDD